jgi:hypothetical protein
MAKLVLNNVDSLLNETTAEAAINGNSDLIEAAIENTLSRDGTPPNGMESNLDMNSHQIINLPAPATVNSPLRLQELVDFTGTGTISTLPAGGTTSQVLGKNSNVDYDVSWRNSVTSVGLSLPADFNITGSPVTTTGTLTGTYATTPTGTGAFVKATSPTLVTPDLGTPTVLVGTNITGTAAGLTAGNVTTNANLTGPITSVGNATSIAAQTGTGTTFVVNTSPTLITPALGVATATSLATAGGDISNLGSGSIARFIVSASNNIGKLFSWRTNNVQRWAARVDGNETGADAGGDWALRRYNDAGTFVDNVLTFVRSTGAATMKALTATSFNKVAITAPATSATLTIPDGVTLTGPAASGTAMTLGNNETVTGVKTFGAAGNVGKLVVAGTTSGTTVINATAVASGTLTLPAVTDTLVGKATTDTFTNKTFNTAAAGNVLQVSNVTVSAGQYPGEPTTGSATAGNVGEYVEAILGSGSATSLTTGTAKTVTSISLGAGDWDVRLVGSFIPAGTTSITQLGAYISLVNNTVDTTAGRFCQTPMAAVVSGGQGFSIGIPPYRFSLSGSTTIYLVVSANFTVSTLTAWGIISARRIR